MASARNPAVQKLELLYERAAKARKPFDVEQVLDAAFYTGKQYISYFTPAYGGTGYFRDIPRDAARPNAPRPVDNQIRHFVMDTYSSAKSHEPAVEVLPQNMDTISVSNAKLEQAYLDHIISPTQANWGAERDRAIFWAVLCGEGWLKWCMTHPIEGTDEEARPDIQFCSPFEIYMDPSATDYRRASWLIHARSMSPEDIFDTYGVEMAATDVDAQDPARTAILRQIGLAGSAPTITVKELWELPSRRHPKGRFITWAAGKALTPEGAPFPYTHKQLPFTQIGHSPLPGTYHYTSGTSAARPLQMELNQYHAQKITARKKFANFKWGIDSAMDMEVMPDESDDQILVYNSRNGSMRPEILQAQPWPDSQDGVWIGEALQDAFGIHGASQGQAPGRVDSAQALDTLQEADRSRLAEITSTLDFATSRGFGQILSLAKQFVSEEQIVVDYSANSKGLVRRFKTDEFSDKPLVRVVSGGGLPKTRASKRAEVISLWTAGMFGTNPRKALEMLDYPTEMNLTGDELDEIESENENALMSQGEAQTAKPWQNHEVHRHIHDNYRKSAEYAAAPQDVWTKFAFHMESHDQQELVEIQEEAVRQARIAQIGQEVADAIQPPDVQGPAEPGTTPPPAGPQGAPPQGP